MAYVPNTYKVGENHLNDILATAGDNINWQHILMVDYSVHNQDNDYDDGLSFLYRLNHKLGRFHNWDVEAFKLRIKNAEDPIEEYILVVSEMLQDRNDVYYYGI